MVSGSRKLHCRRNRMKRYAALFLVIAACSRRFDYVLLNVAMCYPVVQTTARTAGAEGPSGRGRHVCYTPNLAEDSSRRR